MADLVLSGNTSGAITISAPAVAGTNTLTLPANTGTVITTASTFAGTGPAFSAYLSGGNQTISDNTLTKVTFNAEDFDTANCFDSTTNYRFTPNVAGYYIVTCGIDVGATGSCSRGVPAIYKNGSIYRSGTNIGTTTIYSGVVSAQVYFNGSTDYIEIYGQLGGTGPQFIAGSNATATNRITQTLPFDQETAGFQRKPSQAARTGVRRWCG